MPDLSDDDLKFVLSVDPDQDALNKALEQINADIDRAKVSKIKLELEQAWKPPEDVVPVSFWEKKFGKAGEALTKEFEKATETMRDVRFGMDPEILRERIGLERQLSEERKKLEKAEQDERVRQAGGLRAYTREKMGADPESVREKVKQERVTASVRQEKEQAEHSERVRQAGGPMKFMWEQLKGGFGGGGRGGLTTMLGGIMGGQSGGMLGQIGGAAGAALGGPGGAMIGEAIAKMIPEKIAGPAKKVTAAMEGMSHSLQGMQGPLGGIGVGLDLATNMLGGFVDKIKGIPILGEILGPFLDTFVKLPGILKEITQAGISMAAKANPGVMTQLSIALDDAMATIGQAFTPVIQEMIPVIREIGTIIAQALPADEEMREMFRELFDSIRDLVKEMAPLAGPLLRGLIGMVRFFVDALTALATAIKFVVKIITFGLVDLDAKKPGGPPREAIAAARPANIGSFEEYQRKLQLQTYQSPASPEKTMPQTVSNIHTTLNNIHEKFSQLMNPGFLAGVVLEGVWRALTTSNTREMADAAEAGIGGGIAAELARNGG